MVYSHHTVPGSSGIPALIPFQRGNPPGAALSVAAAVGSGIRSVRHHSHHCHQHCHQHCHHCHHHCRAATAPAAPTHRREQRQPRRHYRVKIASYSSRNIVTSMGGGTTGRVPAGPDAGCASKGSLSIRRYHSRSRAVLGTCGERLEN